MPKQLAAAVLRNAWIGFAVVAGTAAMDLLDSTIAQTAAPDIRRALGASYADLEWISAAYTLAMAALMILGSRLGDIFGRRRVLLIGDRRLRRQFESLRAGAVGGDADRRTCAPGRERRH